MSKVKGVLEVTNHAMMRFEFDFPNHLPLINDYGTLEVRELISTDSINSMSFSVDGASVNDTKTVAVFTAPYSYQIKEQS